MKKTDVLKQNFMLCEVTVFEMGKIYSAITIAKTLHKDCVKINIEDAEGAFLT